MNCSMHVTNQIKIFTEKHNIKYYENTMINIMRKEKETQYLRLLNDKHTSPSTGIFICTKENTYDYIYI